MEKDIVNFLKKSKKKARQEELTKPLIENKKQNTKANIKLELHVAHVAIVVKNVKPSKFMFKI